MNPVMRVVLLLLALFLWFTFVFIEGAIVVNFITLNPAEIRAILWLAYTSASITVVLCLLVGASWLE